MRRDTPLTAGERRGLVVVAVIALAVVCVTFFSRMHGGAGVPDGAADPVVEAVDAASASPDTAVLSPRPVRANKKKTNSKRNNKPATPANMPAERSFLDEK